MPHLRLPPALRVSSPLSPPSPSLSFSTSTSADVADSTPRMLPAFASSLSPALSTAQADLSRLTNTLKTLVEMNGQCWKGQDCDLSEGVRQGVSVVSAHTQRHADLLELRVCDSPTLIVAFCPDEIPVVGGWSRLDWRVDAGYVGRSEGSLLINISAPRHFPPIPPSVWPFYLAADFPVCPSGHRQSQRDLYIAMRDLFVRHDRLSVDQVERLKKRVDTNSLKLENVKAVAKEGWEEEADKIAGNIEKDKTTISAQLNRRVFIRAW